MGFFFWRGALGVDFRPLCVAPVLACHLTNLILSAFDGYSAHGKWLSSCLVVCFSSSKYKRSWEISYGDWRKGGILQVCILSHLGSKSRGSHALWELSSASPGPRILLWKTSTAPPLAMNSLLVSVWVYIMSWACPVGPSYPPLLLFPLPIGPLCSPRQLYFNFHFIYTHMIICDGKNLRTRKQRAYIYFSGTDLIHLIWWPPVVPNFLKKT